MEIEQEILNKINQQEEKINEIYKSVEKTRKYFLIMTWITIILFVLPLIGLLFFIPAFIDSFTTSLNGLL